MNNRFNITNSSEGDTLDIYIYEEISDWWGIGKNDLLNILKSNNVSKINLRISSPGGSVDDGLAMYDLIKKHPANVTAYLSGFVASAATLIAMAADYVIASPVSFFLGHESSTYSSGNKHDLRKDADFLDIIDNTIAEIYSKKTGSSVEDMHEFIKKDEFITAEEARQMGLVDEVSDSEELKATARFDLNAIKNKGIKNIPQNIQNIINKNNSDMKIKEIIDGFINKLSKAGITVTDENKVSIQNEIERIENEYGTKVTGLETKNTELETSNTGLTSDIEAKNQEITNQKTTIQELEAKLAISNTSETPKGNSEKGDPAPENIAGKKEGFFKAVFNEISKK